MVRRFQKGSKVTVAFGKTGSKVLPGTVTRTGKYKQKRTHYVRFKDGSYGTFYASEMRKKRR